VCRAENAGDDYRAAAIVQWSPQDRRDGPVRLTDGPGLRQDGVGVVVDERSAQDNWDRQVVDDDEGHRDDPDARLESRRDGTASAQPRVIGAPKAYMLFLLGGGHLAEPVRGEGVPADQVGARPRAHDEAERDEGMFVQAKRGHDAVVVKAEKQNFPAPDGVSGAPALSAMAAAWRRERVRSRRVRPPSRGRSPCPVRAPLASVSAGMPSPPPQGRGSEWPRASSDAANGAGEGTVLVASGAAKTVARSGTSAAALLPLPGRARMRGQKAGAGGNLAAALLLRTWRRRVAVM